MTTRAGKAGVLAAFYEFVISRYQGDIAALTGVVVAQPIDEFNRQSGASLGKVRVPPSDAEVDEMFTAWRLWLPEARKYLPAARDYFAASLWRRLGLRINETVMLDIRDWRPNLGEFGKLHVRHGAAAPQGQSSRATAPLRPAIERRRTRLVDWWLAEVRHLFADDWADPDAPVLPSERHDPDFGRCRRVGADALRQGLAEATGRCLPSVVWPAVPPRAPSLLRLVFVRSRDGPQGPAGAFRPPVAGHHIGLHPCPRRPHRASVGERQPPSRNPLRLGKGS